MGNKFIQGKELLTRWNINQYELLDIVRKGQPKTIFEDEFYKEGGIPKPYILQLYNPIYLRPVVISKICVIELAQTDNKPLSFNQVEDVFPYLLEYLFLIEDIERMERDYPELLNCTAMQPEWEQKQCDNVSVLQSPIKKLTPKQIIAKNKRCVVKEEVRKVAKKLWEKYPKTTKADMAMHNEINSIQGADKLTEKTIENYIADLNPNRKPGRRSKNDT
jgi:hypothetical protein